MTLEGLNNLESIEGDLNISLSPSNVWKKYQLLGVVLK